MTERERLEEIATVTAVIEGFTNRWRRISYHVNDPNLICVVPRKLVLERWHNEK